MLKKHSWEQFYTRVCFSFRENLMFFLGNLEFLSLLEPSWSLQTTAGRKVKVVIWLILPVVICLSQRLSHACLSINSIQWNCEWLIKTVIVYLIIESYMDNRGNSRANTCCQTRPPAGLYLLDIKPIFPPRGLLWWIIVTDRIPSWDKSFKFLPYQLSMVVYWTTMAVTGNGELGFGSGEGAWETATTSKEGSRRVNYPIPIRGGSDKK